MRQDPADHPGASRTERLAGLSLLVITAAWGSSFIVIKDAVAHASAADFLAFRFSLAALALFAFRPQASLALSRRQAARGAALGVVYGLAQLLQTVGLQHLSASVSGFLTGMYVVLTPLFAAVVFRRPVGRNVWSAVLVATAGLGVLSLSGFSISFGDALTLAAAALYAVHILGLGAWSEPGDAYGMATVQMAVIAAVSFVGAAPAGVGIPARSAWFALVFTALVQGALALVVQTWAQAHLPATRAAIIMTGEPVFAAVFAVTLGGEAVTWRLSGGLLVVAAMVMAERRPGSAPPVLPHLAEGP